MIDQFLDFPLQQHARARDVVGSGEGTDVAKDPLRDAGDVLVAVVEVAVIDAVDEVSNDQGDAAVESLLDGGGVGAWDEVTCISALGISFTTDP